MFRWTTGHALAGHVPVTAAVHLPGHRSPLPDGWLHLPLPHSHGYEARRQQNRQIGATDDEDRILQWPLHPARDRTPGLPLLRVLQPGRMDGPVAPRHLQHILHPVPSASVGTREGPEARF